MSKRKRKRRQPLTEQQKEAARLYFEAYKPGQIAEQLGIHRCTVWRWRNLPAFQRYYNKYTEDWLRQKRKETIREIKQSPEYKEQQRRKYAARRKLKRLGEKMSNARSINEFKKLNKEYQKCYNDAYFNGLDPVNFFDKYSSSYRINGNASKEPKYIIEIL